MNYQATQHQQQDSNLKDPFSSPVSVLRTVLDHFWIDRTEEEALAQWQRYVTPYQVQAKIILENLAAVIDAPPPDLPQILQEHGWIYLFHYEDEAQPTPYSFSEHVFWLRQLTARLHHIYEQEHSKPAAILRTMLQNFWLDRLETEAEAEWSTYVKQCPRQAKFILQKLTALTSDPPPDLPQILQKYGWIYLYHDGNGTGPIEYSWKEHVEWVRQMTAQFRCIYEKEQCVRAHTFAPLSADGAMEAEIYDYA